MQTLFIVLMCLMALFLIMLVLIQRGKGGGLAGAFGGAGGQSAFGTKTGDVYMRATIVAAAVWIGLCMVAIWTLSGGEALLDPGAGRAAPAAEEDGELLLSPEEEPIRRDGLPVPAEQPPSPTVDDDS